MPCWIWRQLYSIGSWSNTESIFSMEAPFIYFFAGTKYNFFEFNMWFCVLIWIWMLCTYETFFEQIFFVLQIDPFIHKISRCFNIYIQKKVSIVIGKLGFSRNKVSIVCKKLAILVKIVWIASFKNCERKLHNCLFLFSDRNCTLVLSTHFWWTIFFFFGKNRKNRCNLSDYDKRRTNFYINLWLVEM